KFGAFVALCRKEKNMTQLELAQELKVTDKAVSRWERGKGFPDISLLVPLAEALDITVLELMNSEKREKRMEDFSEENIKDMVIHVAAIEEKNQRDDRLITWIPVPVALITAFLTRFTGHGSLLAGLLLGGLTALAVVGLVLFVLDRKDNTSRKAYGILMLLGTGVTLVFLYLMGISTLLLLGGLFLLLCITTFVAFS
ncbi:MAG: helix-turn-helix transcriptional regulator, partial [Clostridiales bacterium]|nr:helix-turn-helix transcriptional regulator [Clostridiales bacterium]